MAVNSKKERSSTLLSKARESLTHILIARSIEATILLRGGSNLVAVDLCSIQLVELWLIVI